MRPFAGILAASTLTAIGLVVVGCDLDLQPFEESDGGPVIVPGDGGGGPQDASPVDAGGPRDAGLDAETDAGDAGTGSTRKRVFVTSTTTTGAIGTLGGLGAIEAANQRCQQLADAAKLGGKFVAWLSVTGNSAFDRLEDVGPWYLVDQKTLVFASKDVIKTLGPNVPIEFDETGKRVGDPESVWTGTNSNGQAVNANCNNFLQQNAALNGLMGEVDKTGAAWTQVRNVACNQQHRLYCFEQ